MVVAAQNADLVVDSRGESTQTRILDSAEYLFSGNGVNGASLRAIVAHAGVNTAAVHYHFGSKNGLLEAVFARRTVPIAEERLKLLAKCREGVGLGLFLADRLVAAHGGRIDVESGPDSGTAFTIRLPSARDS